MMRLSDIKICSECKHEDIDISLTTDINNMGECLVIIRCSLCYHSGGAYHVDKDNALEEAIKEWNSGWWGNE